MLPSLLSPSPALWQRWSRLQRLGGGRLASRIVALSLLLLLVVQAAGFAVVRESMAHNVRGQIAADLRLGERVWRRLLDTHAQRLRQAATVLAADYAFREAVASNDTGTIDSALQNHGARIGATMAALLDTQFKPRALHAGDDPGGAAAASAALAAQIHDAAAQTARDHFGSGLLLINGLPHQIVAVPLRAPVTIGWVVMGFPLGQPQADDMHLLSGLQVAMLVLPQGRQATVAATTLPQDQAQQLGAAATSNTARQRTWHFSETETSGAGELMAHTLVQPASGGQLHTVLLRSVADAAAPFHRLQFVLAAITAGGVLLFGIGSTWTAHRVTTPLRRLVEASERLGRGDHSQAVHGTRRDDEIGDLARAFDHMRGNIAAHEAELHQLAFNDRLTGLPNRAGFRSALAAAIGALPGSRAGEACIGVAVVMIDLDRFKHVNDVLGYAMGDRLLCAVSERLATQVLRRGDLLARLSGDEFALLLPEADAAAAMAVAMRITESFVAPITLDDHQLDLGGGVGIARWPADAGDVDTLMARAELAMYAAKRRGSEAPLAYDPALDGASSQNLSLLSELRRAVDGGQLRLFLQPKIGMRGRRPLAGAEALVRWQHPERGMVPPGAFIPFAEQTGFIRRLTLWVVEEAARHWAALQACGGDAVRISINLSTRDLMDVELPGKLAALLARHDAPASGFCLEITESAIMDDPGRAEATLNALAAQGFKLSIDDFGTGYSSLAYLKRLPVHELKIDRSFVMGLEREGVDSGDAKIVRSTIDLAHNLGLTVVAEGIEDAKVFAALAALDCDEGQGYHMSRPLPLADFVAWAARWREEHGGPALPPPQPPRPALPARDPAPDSAADLEAAVLRA